MLRELPSNRVIVLPNVTCPYCSVALDPNNRTKEHAIGRRFVPTGTLHGTWNLILWACRSCNNVKSQLEDDIAAISLQPTVIGQFARPEPAFIQDASRKAAGSFSRRTQKLVGDSSETFTVETQLAPGARMTAKLRTQPQLDKDRVFRLAKLHARAFFYYFTYNEATRTGGFWLGEFWPLMSSLRADWGNAIQLAFMEAVVNWEPEFIGGTADGMFKVAIRRSPEGDVYSWALEWNENVRVIGFCGNCEAAETIAKTFPTLETPLIPRPDGSHIGVRIERALAPEMDRLSFGPTLQIKRYRGQTSAHQ